MSRIDELQRLYEAATPGEWFATDDGRVTTGHGDTLFHDDSVLVSSENEMAQAAALHNSWPAIHRVLLAAREVAANEADDIDSRLRYVEVRPGRDEWRELVEALRALDGDKGAT